MKNFFEFFGFLSMACISAALIFIVVGKKDALKSESGGRFLSEMGTEGEISDAPRSISDRPLRSSAAASSKRDKAARPIESNAPEISSEQRLKSLYDDRDFVATTAKEWKGLVRDAADEYNVKPQVLLAHVVVQTYLGDYSRAQLYQDAARHAGERLKPTATAVKGYKYGWSMQKLINEQQLLRYFPEEKPVATVAASAAKSAPGRTPQRTKGFSTPVAKNNPMEEGFKNMVAKEYGFTSWAGLQKLADPGTRSDASRRVQSLMMASRVR